MATMASPEFTRHSSFDNLHKKLDDFWGVVRDLDVNASQDIWDKFVSYLSPKCVLYLHGMGGPACRGPDDTVKNMKKTLSYWTIIERRVLSRGTDLEGRTVFANMDNRLAILGEELDLAEAEVVEFDEEGKILDYKLYCDPAPVMAIIQKAQQKQSS